jgi:uncharacterized protein (UPF0335 family)
MKKLIIAAFCLGAFLFTGKVLNAQGNAGNPGNAGNAGNAGITTNNATPANVLKWTKEVLPKMELLVPKLEKIKADTEADKKEKEAGINDIMAEREKETYYTKALAVVIQMRAINAKGTRLKAAEAKRYYDLIAATVNSFYIECKSKNGDVCCVECHNNAILGVWCFANCFVARFPDNDN